VRVILLLVQRVDDFEITAKRNVQVPWSLNSADLVAVLCDDYPNLGIHKGAQVRSLRPLPKIPRLRIHQGGKQMISAILSRKTFYLIDAHLNYSNSF
jgi:hypothetical protein